MKSRTPRTRLIVGTVAALLISACDTATETTPAKSNSELEADLQHARQSLERSQQALADAERHIFALRGEQTRDRGRITELTARSAGLERQNREMSQQLARTRGRLAHSASIQTALRQQGDQNARRVRELGIEQQALRARLSSAYAQVRQLQARPLPDRRQISDLHQRRVAAARELEELRRYNSFLLQERSNLQAWLQEANAARNGEQEALQQSLLETDRIKSDADAASQKLRVELDKAGESLTELRTTRDALAEEARSLRATLSLADETERERSEQLEKALAHASSLADANERMASELQNSQRAPDQPRVEQGAGMGDVSVLRADLDQATRKIAKLQAANSYLVEKIEACALPQRSSRAEIGRPRLIAVAKHAEEQPTSNRREKELNEVKKKLQKLRQEQDALAQRLQQLEAENAAAKKQIQTLTWANEVLVKELDAAYAGREASGSASLPKGTRGLYVLRQGESLSRVAKAFYGDPGRWKNIVEANKDKIPDPDRVKAGTVILIPE